jgi:2,5-diamino-6-(ribosylamino)-4(3H)-pyrimidinone 5'-phosphate reductase
VKKPYIVCHMMTSLDGRIDCAMTEQLPGVQEYYQILEALQAPTTVSGRVTAQLEMALPGDFQAKDSTPVGKEAFSRKTDAMRWWRIPTASSCGRMPGRRKSPC